MTATAEAPANVEDLSDEELEKVASGMTPLWVLLGIGCGFRAAAGMMRL
jgi:hypothetical protein